MSPVEESILKAVFKDKVITDILVDHLLPVYVFNQEMKADGVLTPEFVYDLARSRLKDNLNRLLEK